MNTLLCQSLLSFLSSPLFLLNSYTLLFCRVSFWSPSLDKLLLWTLLLPTDQLNLYCWRRAAAITSIKFYPFYFLSLFAYTCNSSPRSSPEFPNLHVFSRLLLIWLLTVDCPAQLFLTVYSKCNCLISLHSFTSPSLRMPCYSTYTPSCEPLNTQGLLTFSQFLRQIECCLNFCLQSLSSSLVLCWSRLFFKWFTPSITLVKIFKRRNYLTLLKV